MTNCSTFSNWCTLRMGGWGGRAGGWMVEQRGEQASGWVGGWGWRAGGERASAQVCGRVTRVMARNSPCYTRPPAPPSKHPSPEDAQRVAAVAACLLAEAGGVAHVLDGQLLLLEPPAPVQRAQRLLARRNQVLFVAVACRGGGRGRGWGGGGGSAGRRAGQASGVHASMQVARALRRRAAHPTHTHTPSLIPVTL